MTAVYPIAVVLNGSKRIAMGLTLAVAMMFPRSDALAKQSGTSILHFNFASPMTNTGADPDASGTVSGKLNSQGNASNQQLKIALANLNPNTTYQLVAVTGDEINSTNVTALTTDSKGAVKVTFVKKTQGNASAGGQPLPGVLSPLNNVRELDIVNSNAQTVLTADLTNPAKFQYLAKRFMDNTGFISNAVGSFQIKATATSTQFRLRVSGLTLNTDYILMLNGTAAETITSDGAGNLNLKALPEGAPAGLAIHSLGLTDINSNLILTVSGGLGISPAGQAPVALGAAATFAVLGGSTVTSAGNTIVNGDLGVSPGTAVTGFFTVDAGPGIVNGTIYNATPGPAATAQGDLATAYNDAAGRTVGAIIVAGNLGGQTLAPGLYKSTSSLEISSGDLTLDAQGDANAVFIFQMASTLTTTAGRQVILAGGAKAANVFWQVGSSAMLGTTSIFKGNILALAAITVTTGATLDGRALALTDAVTLDANTVTIPAP